SVALAVKVGSPRCPRCTRNIWRGCLASPTPAAGADSRRHRENGAPSRRDALRLRGRDATLKLLGDAGIKGTTRTKGGRKSSKRRAAAQQIDFVKSGTESLQPHRWRKPDSNRPVP